MASQLYGNIFSTCTQRVMFLLEELGLPYELHSLEMSKGEHKAPAYVETRHPFGRLPAFEDSDVKIYESRAICRYLVAQNPGVLILPISGKDLALFEQAASVEYSYFDPNVTSLAYEKMFKSMMGCGAPDPVLVEKYEALLRECLDVYEIVLAECQYLGGQSFGLVDIFHAPWINFLLNIDYGEEISSRPNLSSWWARVSDRGGWKAMTSKLQVSH